MSAPPLVSKPRKFFSFRICPATAKLAMLLWPRFGAYKNVPEGVI